MFQRSSSKKTTTKMSRSEMYRYLLQQQLERYWVSVSGSNLAGTQTGGFTMQYNDIRVTFEVAEDYHTFMICTTVYQIAENGEDSDDLFAHVHRLERGLGPFNSDIRLELDDEDQIVVYQNVPMDLVQEECFKDFEELTDRFMKEATRMNLSLSSRSPVPPPSARTSPLSAAWKRRGSKMKHIFSGRAA